MPLAAAERLYGGLAVDHGGNDVTVLGFRLLAHDNPVTVADRRLDHRVTLDLQQEQRALPDQLSRQREDLVDRLLGEDRAAGGGATDQRYVGRFRSAGQQRFVLVGRQVR